MPTFKPPTDDFLSLADIDVDVMRTTAGRRAFNLFRHYDNLPRGRNVYKMIDGTYRESDPSDWATVATAYYGGHEYTVTDAEAADLTANGYWAYIS